MVRNSHTLIDQGFFADDKDFLLKVGWPYPQYRELIDPGTYVAMCKLNHLFDPQNRQLHCRFWTVRISGYARAVIARWRKDMGEGSSPWLISPKSTSKASRFWWMILLMLDGNMEDLICSSFSIRKNIWCAVQKTSGSIPFFLPSKCH